MKPILTVQNAKTSKGEPLGWLTGILYLAPHRMAGGFNVCPHATEGCKAACLYSAGRGRFTNVQNARIRKTQEFMADPVAFVDRLAVDIARLEKKALRLGMSLAVRLNGTSDIDWQERRDSQGVTLFARFPQVQFYDYTKRPNLQSQHANYHVTRSASEATTEDSIRHDTCNVAVVFNVKRGQPLPAYYAGKPVVDGDLHDLRFIDGSGVVVGLRAKGMAKKDQSGFVRKVD